MGVAYGDLRKKTKSYTNKMIVEKKFKDNTIKRKVTSRFTSKIMNDFKEDNRFQQKTEKTLDCKKKTKENKKANMHIKNIRCLSVENLVKIEGQINPENKNPEEIYLNSLDTNFSSNKSSEEFAKRLLVEDINNDIYDNNNNSSDEEKEEEESEEIEEKEENDQNKEKDKNKINELMITNNIKTVFVYSKIQGKDQNSNNFSINLFDDNNSNISSRSSSATFDYELNFYKSGNEIRESYISKLISMNIWNPSMKPKQHNSIIIFDWDDTLFPTSFLTPGGIFNEDIKLSEVDKNKLLILEQCTFTLLNEAIKKGNVYIITNAGKGWVEYSANKFYPSIKNFLSEIKIISARGEYEKMYPGNSRQWKIQAFLTLLKYVDIKLVTNIICIGDSLFEMEAGRILASKFTKAFIKTVKFKEVPKLDELIKQLKLVCNQFNSIYSSIKNLTIRVEKKKKEIIK